MHGEKIKKFTVFEPLEVGLVKSAIKIKRLDRVGQAFFVLLRLYPCQSFEQGELVAGDIHLPSFAPKLKIHYVIVSAMDGAVLVGVHLILLIDSLVEYRFLVPFCDADVFFYSADALDRAQRDYVFSAQFNYV